MLPSVVDTRPPHHAVRREPVDPSKARGPPRRGIHSTTRGLTGSRVPATGPRGSGTDPSRPEPARLPPSSAVSRGRRLLAEAELAAVDSQAMQDGRELAGHRHLGPSHAPALGHLQPPALE